MAVVQVFNNVQQNTTGLKFIIGYAINDKKTEIETGKTLVSGINCNPLFAYNEFMVTRYANKQNGGRFFYHYCQSFSPDEKITPEEAHLIGVEIAKSFKGFEVVVGTHLEKEHIHNHLIVNAVNFETGKKLHQDKQSLYLLRNLSDEICKRYNLSVLPPSAHIKIKGMGYGEHHVALKGNSWKFKLINTIENCMKQSRTKHEFIQNMKAQNYYMLWTDERKYITYTTPNGMKCRDDKLHEEKFLKGNMENEFKIRELQRAKQTTKLPNGFDTGATATYESETEFNLQFDYSIRKKQSIKRTDREDSEFDFRFKQTGWEDTRRYLFGIRQTNEENLYLHHSDFNNGSDWANSIGSRSLRILRLAKSISQVGSKAYDDIDEFIALAAFLTISIAAVYALIKIIIDIPDEDITDDFIENIIEQVNIDYPEEQNFGEMTL